MEVYENGLLEMFKERMRQDPIFTASVQKIIEHKDYTWFQDYLLLPSCNFQFNNLAEFIREIEIQVTHN